MVVIDDEVNTCTFLRTVFEAEGHACHTFVRAEEAEQFLANNPSRSSDGGRLFGQPERH